MPLDAVVTGHRTGPRTLRWVYLQVLREPARHCGHDVLREQVLAGRAEPARGRSPDRSLSPVSHSAEISVSRVFDAPRELVFRAFVDPDQLCQWFGPDGYSMPAESVQSDARTGGFQRFTLVSDADPSRRVAVDAELSQVM